MFWSRWVVWVIIFVLIPLVTDLIGVIIWKGIRISVCCSRRSSGTAAKGWENRGRHRKLSDHDGNVGYLGFFRQLLLFQGRSNCLCRILGNLRGWSLHLCLRRTRRIDCWFCCRRWGSIRLSLLRCNGHIIFYPFCHWEQSGWTYL
jgi:hypothetical protein